MVTRVHLLRHGEVHNPAKILYGRLPGFRLSETGERMAEIAAAALEGRDVTLLLTSPLERARQTAAPLAETFGLEPRVDERLIESGNKFEGRPVGEGWRSFADLSALRLLRNPFEPSWGEPYVETADRMHSVVRAMRDEARGHEAVAVSHQLPIYVLRRYAEGRRLWHRPDKRQCGLASLTTLTFQGERLVSVAYSEPAGSLSRKQVPPGA
ncbi:MAG TPA: histidine phosphatase family protein [Frankiaceae bacterium]|nr:histidine phosphatase family protein [Frankiaceae bacterium]